MAEDAHDPFASSTAPLSSRCALFSSVMSVAAPVTPIARPWRSSDGFDELAIRALHATEREVDLGGGRLAGVDHLLL